MKLSTPCKHCGQPYSEHFVSDSRCPIGNSFFFADVAKPDDPKPGPCPAWCELPAGHDWEDEWQDGLIRYHKVTRPVDENRWHNILIEEVEQVLADGSIKRQRWLTLDVESPTQWEYPEALKGVDIMRTLLNMALADWPNDGEVT